MSIRKITLRKLFSNKKFLLVFSIVVAFIFWIAVALEYAPIVENVVKGVPVTINLENSVPEKMGFKVFGNKDFTVDVTVKGSRYIVGGKLLNANDFEATAQTAYVNSPGINSLRVNVIVKNPESEFEIVSVSDEFIEAYFDIPEEKEISVEPRIISELTSYTSNGYIFDENDIILPNTLKISGPKAVLDNITTAYADIELRDKLNTSVETSATVNFDNLPNNERDLIKISGVDNFKIPITLPVFKVVTQDVRVDFTNRPQDFIEGSSQGKSLSYSCTPSKIKVAVLQVDGEIDDYFKAGTISFNEISPTNNIFKFKTDGNRNEKILDSTKEITVKVDTKGISAVSVKPDDEIAISSGNGNGFNVDFSSLGDITVVGNSFSIANIKTTDIILSYNADDVEVGNAPVSVPASLTLKNKTDCWIYGDYTVKISAK